MRARGTTAALLVVLGVVLLTPTIAQATVTIGSNLGRAPGGPPASEGCSPPCTFFQGTLAADRTASGGLVSPVNGTVTLWRIGAAGQSTPTALRVIRPLSGGLYTGAGTSATVTPALNSTSTFPTSLPISIGDAIGIDCCMPAAQYFVGSGGNLAGGWNPILADGGPGRPDEESTSPHEIVLNADIEPTSAFTIGLVKPGKGGKVTVSTVLPNPGVLEGGDKRDASLAAAAGGKKPKLLFKHASMTAAVANQTIRLLVKPTKLARSLLASKGKVKAKLKVVFTPAGGSPSTQVLKVKLKR
jgi:hypothetical protein